MITDTHTHVYPDKIAQIIKDKMVRDAGEDGAPFYGSFTLASLIEAMDKNGVETSVLFCVAERQEVVRAANDFLLDTCDGKRFIAFGNIHPDMEDYKAEMERLRQSGVKGIKWHSWFQSLRLDEDRMMNLYEAMGDDMIAYFHMGVLGKTGEPAKHMDSTPEMLARVMDTFPKMKIVAAHFGGMGLIDESRKHLVGKNLYLDTTWTLGELDPNLAARIITEHGVEKMLFGTDYPFGNHAKDIAFIRNLPLSDEDKERIFWKNAEQLLGI